MGESILPTPHTAPQELEDLTRIDPLDPVSDPPLWQVVADSLRRKIKKGVYLPGHRLPAERQLAEDLGVSRVTVRDALRALQVEQLIETRRGSAGGAEVRPPLRRSDEEIRGELRRKLPNLLWMLDCRGGLESVAAEQAALNCTDELIGSLKKAVDAMERAMKELEETVSVTTVGETLADEEEAAKKRSESVMNYRLADSLFHIPLVKASGNPYLFKRVEDLRTEFFMPVDVLYRLGGTRQDTAGEHAAILSAIRKQNKDKAAEEMRKHIESTRSTLLRLLGQES